MAKNPRLLEELVINVNSRALKQAEKQQSQLGDRMEDAAAGTELLNEQINITNAALTEARKLSRGLANSLETIGTGANMQDYFDGVVAAIQDVEGTISELSASFEEYTHIARQGNDEVVLTLERLLDPLRKVDQQTKKTAASTEKLQEGFKGAGDSQAKASKGIEGVQRSTKGGTRAFQDLAKIAGPLPMIYATIAANVYALTAAYDQLAAGDRLNRLEKINTVIGQEQGVAVSQLAEIMQEATGYAISFDGAMQKAAQASAYGFSTDQVEQFTLAARRASVALGVDLDDAMNRIIRGVSKLEIELLDELGITVRLTEAYDKYQRTLGVSQTALTGYQKQQAYANAVIEESTKRFGNLDKAMAATPWERMQAGIDQSVKSGQKWISSFLAPAAEIIADLLEKDKLKQAAEGLDKISESQEGAQSQGKFLQFQSLQEGQLEAQQKITTELAQKVQQLNSVERALNDTRVKTAGEIAALRNKQKQLRDEIDVQNTSLREQEKQFLRIGKQSGLLTGSMEQINEQNAKYSLWLRESQQLMKALPETQSVFDQSIKKGKAPTEEIAQAWDSAVLSYNRYQELIDKVDYTTVEGQQVYDEYKQQQQELLLQTGSKNFEELNLKQKKAAEATQVFNNELFNSANTQAKISKEMQFQQGVADQLAVNKQAIQEIDQQLAANLDQTSDGTKVRLISEEKELELRTKKLDLQRQNLQLSQQQNSISAQQKQVLADTQYQQQLLNNADPLKQKLRLIEQQISQQQALNQQNRGLSKPEEQAQQENQLVDLMSQKRDILRAISDRETQIAQAKQESLKLDTLLAQTSKDRFQDSVQELQLLKDSERILKLKLETAIKYGETEEATLQIQNEIKANQLEQAQAQKGIVKSKYEALEQEVQLRGREMGLSELDILQQQVQTKKEFIQTLQQEKASRAEIYEQQMQLRELELQQQNAKQAESVKYRNLGMDALGSQGSVPLIQGPTQIGDQQLKEQELQTAMDAINKSFSELSSYNPVFSDMIANVSNLGLAFHQMGEGAQTGQQVAAQGMSTVASMLNMASQQTISGIDQQIAAEKERDGKSEESKKKIQKLEAEKAAAQKKAQTEQIVMQTAMGITQALATLPPPVSYAMAATTQQMGLQALKSQQSGSAIAGVEEASVPSLSLGERDNRIDVSRSASAGELQYIQGGDGVGNASDFKPRAVGNRAPANHQVLVGENGPEVVAFDTPGMITAQNQASSNSYGSNFNVTIQALDSESLQSYLQKNGQIFASSMEYQLNSEGYSMYRK